MKSIWNLTKLSKFLLIKKSICHLILKPVPSKVYLTSDYFQLTGWQWWFGQSIFLLFCCNSCDTAILKSFSAPDHYSKVLCELGVSLGPLQLVPLLFFYPDPTTEMYLKTQLMSKECKMHHLKVFSFMYNKMCCHQHIVKDAWLWPSKLQILYPLQSNFCSVMMKKKKRLTQHICNWLQQI